MISNRNPAIWTGPVIDFIARNLPVLDWLFFNNWRMTNGWLTPEERQRALGIVHDPLAMKVRREVVKRLWPERTEMAE